MSPGLYGNTGFATSSMYANGMPQTYFRGMEQPVIEQGKGKGKMKEEDFEAAFAQAAASLQSAPLQSAHVEEVGELGEALAETSLDDGVTDFKQCVLLRIYAYFFSMVMQGVGSVAEL